MHANQNSEAKATFRKFSEATVQIEFTRRLGPDPHANARQTVALNNCPDVFELSSGDFAIIGIDITDAAKLKLPPTAGCGPDERIVFIPRNLLVEAKRDIPDTL